MHLLKVPAKLLNGFNVRKRGYSSSVVRYVYPLVALNLISTRLTMITRFSDIA